MNNPDDSLWKRMYNEDPEFYDRLIRYEDYQGNLLPTLNQIHPLQGARIVEFGAGTGRFTSLLSPIAGQILAFDLTPGMLGIACRKLLQKARRNWGLGLADSRAMPVASGYADISLEGWSFLHIMLWHLDNWLQEVDRAIQEMLRLLRMGGTAILVETLGTGKETPDPPHNFKIFYQHIEKEWGFQTRWVRTDYLFDSATEAWQIMLPVFGKAVLETAVETPEGIIIPECTGIWWRRK